MSGVQTFYTIQRNVYTADSSSSSNGTLVLSGGLGIYKNINIGGSQKIFATADASNIESGCFHAAGGASIAKSLYVGQDTHIIGQTYLDNSTGSTSSTIGALVISGGLAVAENVNVGGDGIFDGTLEVVQKVLFDAVEDATDSLTGALQVIGGISTGAKLYAQSDIKTAATVYSNALDVATGVFTITNTGLINNDNTVDAADISTGSLHLDGGASVAKHLYIGEDEHVLGIMYADNTEESTSPSSGAFVVTGGAGIMKQLEVGGITYLTNTTNAVDSSSGSLQVSGGAGFQGDVFIQGALTIAGIVTAESIVYEEVSYVTSTADSSSTSTGAVQVAGGIGVSKSIYVGQNVTTEGDIKVLSTVNATSTTTGAFQVAGGASIQQDVYIGGKLDIVGALNFDSAVIKSSINSTSSDTGALQIVGGVGIGADLFVEGIGSIESDLNVGGGAIIGGNVDISGGITVDGNSSFVGDVTVPTQAYDDNTHVIANDEFVKTQIMTQNIAMIAPMGFENQTDSVVTYDSTTRILTISPASTSFNVWVKGQRHTFSAPVSATAHADVAGTTMYYYFDSNFTFQSSASFPSLNTYAIAAYVYYYSATVFMYNEERHACVMDPATHAELHSQIGTYFVSGLAASNYVVAPVSPIDSDNQVAFETGVISDEQLNTTISAVPTTGPYSVVQLNGATAVWSWSATTVPFLVDGSTGFIEYNSFSTTWGLTPLTTGQWVNYYVMFVPAFVPSTIVTPGLDSPQVLIIPGQAVYDSLSDAKTESFYLLNTASIPVPEFLPLYQITLHADATYTDVVGKCRIESFLRLVGSRVSILNNVGSNHEALAGLQLAGPGVTWGHITYLTQTIDGIKEFMDTTQSTSSSTGAVIVDGGLGVMKDVHIGGHTDLSGVLTVLNTTESTSPSTGAVIIDGGVGIAKVLEVGGQIVASDTANSFTVTSGALVVAGGVGIAMNATIGGVTTITNTTVSSDATTGALVVSGGVGITGSLHVSGGIAFDSTVNSTSPSTGSLVLLGGLGVTKDLVMGGELLEITNAWGQLEQRVVNLGTVITIAPAAAVQVYSLTVTAPTAVNLAIMGYDETTKGFQCICSTSYIFMPEGTSVISAMGDAGSPENLYWNNNSSGWNFVPGAFSFVDGGSGAVSIKFTNNGSLADNLVVGSVSVTKQIGVIH